ncbi:hypothetical protein AMJ87_03430 [candidate division WOR_3 bacterium SM23_60]|uniref:Uncharacterized protein n=1 Tax=candidate division WOR_3 bacterium SM23_60 TaxID=1703780 RepID=A0A0S8GJM2_UNCW3|nr:MAG: hypothetical protein AMJ87_03430 [candidate division WOR_3 bacterium SM23_60]
MQCQEKTIVGTVYLQDFQLDILRSWRGDCHALQARLAMTTRPLVIARNEVAKQSQNNAH